MKRWKLLTGVIFVLFMILIPAISFADNDSNGEMEEILIEEYNGIRLDDFSSFRENSIRGVQLVDKDSYSLLVDGEVNENKAFSYAELLDMEHFRKQITLNCVEGWTARVLWDGIPLMDIFEMTGLTENATSVIFHCHDGYTTSLDLSYIRERNIMIADKINGVTLPPAQGFPYIVIAEDKWGYKWARWVVRIEVVDDVGYRGFWESRGYSNDGSLDKPMFEGAPRD